MSNTLESVATHDEIAAHAYQIYLREGCTEGRDLDNWLKAEQELQSRPASFERPQTDAKAFVPRDEAPVEQAATLSAQTRPAKRNGKRAVAVI